MRFSRNAKIAGIVILALLVLWRSHLYLMIIYPAKSEKAVHHINFYEEPIQEPTSEEPFYLTDREGIKIKITPVTTYEIQARVAINRTYPNYFHVIGLNDLLTNDLALVWGRFAENKIFQQVTFANQLAYSTFRYTNPELNDDPGLIYLSVHFSSNHLITNKRNINHALRRVRTGDIVRVKGYLINIDIPGQNTINTSLVRTDNWTPGEGNTGGSEFIYVTEFQNGDQLYR